MQDRQRHFALPDFSGQRRTLAYGQEAWLPLHKGGQDILLLGLGTGPDWLLNNPPRHKVFWLEAPLLLSQTHSDRFLPDHWQKVAVDQALSLFSTSTVYFYRAALFFAPDFWGPLLGQLFARTGTWHHAHKNPSLTPPVLLLGNKTQLLHQELQQSLQELGYNNLVCELAPDWESHPERSLEEACQGRIPSFCLSVNTRGLDSHGRLFSVLEALKVPCAIWFVDNPWHVLSRIKLPWWKIADLCVTDPSFLADVRALQAKAVSFLPLACAPHMWRSLPEEPADASLKNPPLFVGRSAFPDKERYFAAARIPPQLKEKALALLTHSTEQELPHIHWWYRHCPCTLWPGSSARTPGAGAELCAQMRRVLWLRQGVATGLTIIGDAQWATLIPFAKPLPPVDYYTQLPDLYHKALAVLNVTSLQLPQSLSQRHFDVWAAGGVLLSDATEGLSLFPRELTAPVTLRSPTELAAKLAEIRNEPARFLQLRRNFRRLLREKHAYTHRINTILSHII